MESIKKSSSHAVFDLKLHIVFVTKYRRKSLSPEILEFLDESFRRVLRGWDCELLEFGGEPDHVHLLAAIHPALDISALINNLKSASAKACRNRFAEHLAKIYWKPVFWTRAYFVCSVGSASLETIKAYVERQGTEEHYVRKGTQKIKRKNRYPSPGDSA